MCKPIFPPEGYLFDTHTDVQNGFIKRIRLCGTENANEWIAPYKAKGELSYPRKLRFQWEADGSDVYKVEISESQSFSSAFVTQTKNTTIFIGNLKIGQRYFWRINGGKTSSFSTVDNEYRFIRVNGALNVRDLGGVNIRQGLIFRGSEFNEYYHLKKSGRSTLINDLKIKSELDLRGCETEKTTSYASKKIRRVSLWYRPYKEIFEDRHKATLCDIMRFFADEDNYPVYMHCVGGADRTGMIAIFLRAIAGEDDESILTDYELTGVSDYAMGITEGATGFRSRRSDYFKEYVDMLDSAFPESSGSFAEKNLKFLSLSGVSDETTDKIKKIIKI